MRVPYAWLRDYVAVDLSPEALANQLTLHGLECDRVEYPWPGLVTAEILWLEPIADSDHLLATRVWTGREELSVVCGAANIRLHDRVPLAQVGARVGEVVIQSKRARGVLSEGMLCSPRELGLSEDHSGIYILPPETPVGVPLGQVLAPERAVIDLDIKAHRGDLLCMVGIAREVAAFTGATLRPPDVTVAEKGTPARKLLTVEVRDPDLCPRYTARVVRNVTIAPSPAWMAERLTAAGMRPINNVVDVTNYVMLELGQPLHAFDYDKLTDHTLVIRRAQPGEQLTTLDGVARTLTSEMLLITDPAGPAVIGGIFGGARVEVGAETKHIVLEAAHFQPTNIRRTAQALSLRTESSSRFEKNPDVALTQVALDRAAQLLAELAGGTVAPGRVDAYPTPLQPRQITLALSQVEWLTAARVPAAEAVAALRALGCAVAEQPRADGEVLLEVTVPTGRGDLEEGADLVEEIVRIAGYDRIPSAMPTGPLPPPHHETWWAKEDRLREVLVGAGLTEIVTYTLTNRTAMARLLSDGAAGTDLALGAPVPSATPPAPPTSARALTGQAQERRHLEALATRLPAIPLANPASTEMDTLRLTLLAGLLQTVRENARHEDAGLWFFELGRRYLPTPGLLAGTDLAQERPTLGIAISGPLAHTWQDERPADFFDLKGLLERVLAALQVDAARFLPGTHPSLHPGRAALLAVRAVDEAAPEAARAVAAESAWSPVGILGEVHPTVAARFELPRRTYVAEVDLERLFAAVPARVLQRPIVRFPTATRDLALVVGDNVPAGDVAETLRAAGAPLVREVRLFDVYTGERVPEGHKSLAFAIVYQAADRTLGEAEVERAQKALLRAAQTRHGATLRG